MNRRQFMARTAAVNVALSAASPAFAAPGFASRTTPFERVVADSRLAPSFAFAAALARQGTRVSATDGDLTSLWFDDVARHFVSGGAPVAGLTTPRIALVMLELARGPGVHVLWRAEHTAMRNGSWRHEIEGPAPLVATAARRIESSGWVAGLASALDELDAGEAWQMPKDSAVVTAPGSAGSFDDALSSWVLLPRRTAQARHFGH